MRFPVKIEKFEGPLDLLLQLIESQELEITDVSLAQVTEPFVEHVRAQEGKIPPEDLADFLVVAAKLVYLKSKALLPGYRDEALEEGPDLETQLRMYKAYLEAARRLDEMSRHGIRSFGRPERPWRQMEPGFHPPVGVGPETLRQFYERVVARLEPIVRLPRAAVERVVSIEEKIRDLTERVRRALRVSFHKILAEAQDRSELVVSFLALLELIKQRSVTFHQTELFHDIQLEATKDV
jgi:segregation and condensation protein A